MIADVLAGLGLAEAAARFHARDAELLATNRARITEGRAEMQRFGARGVPTLILDTGQGRTTVDSSTLYGDADRLAAALGAA